MKTQREYIDILSKNAKKIREDFGLNHCVFLVLLLETSKMKIVM